MTEQIFERVIKYIYVNLGDIDDSGNYLNVLGNVRYVVDSSSFTFSEKTKINPSDNRLHTSTTYLGYNYYEYYNIIDKWRNDNYNYPASLINELADTNFKNIAININQNENIKELFIDAVYAYLSFMILKHNFEYLNTLGDSSNKNKLLEENNRLINYINASYENFQNLDIINYESSKDNLGNLNRNVAKQKKEYNNNLQLKDSLNDKYNTHTYMLILTIIMFVIIMILLMNVYDKKKYGIMFIIFMLIYYGIVSYFNKNYVESFTDNIISLYLNNITKTEQTIINNFIDRINTNNIGGSKMRDHLQKEKQLYSNINTKMKDSNSRLKTDINYIKHSINRNKHLNDFLILLTIGIIIILCFRDWFVISIVFVYFIIITTIMLYNVNNRINSGYNNYYWSSSYSK